MWAKYYAALCGILVEENSMVCVTSGQKFRLALEKEQPLQIVGAINAYTAIMAQQVGYRALYLSGAGVANASYGLPDLGITSLDNVLEDVRRITSVVDLPLLVDADTGWGHAFNIARTVKQMLQAGAAGIHLEDQVTAKRCGHRPGKALVETEEMVDRLKAAVDARTDNNFVIMARTDAAAVEGLSATIERAQRYVAVGADMIFAEALTTLEDYRTFTAAIKVPVLANITEFGKTPLFTAQELASVGIKMVLYPLSAFRAMNEAALRTYQTIREQGTQKAIVPLMQTRDALYDFLHYTEYEKFLDKILKSDAKK
jgi:methylisocitrate lyase